jgi:DNA-directed RNA polymerase specialized sigma24 family protein
MRTKQPGIDKLEAMTGSRSVPTDLWITARQRLVAYFSRRGFTNAEDLAHDTLSAIWERDYPCDRDEDFLKICYGFARNIIKEALREAGRVTEEFSEQNPPSSFEHVSRFSNAEISILLKEVQETGAAHLQPEEWAAIEAAMVADDSTPPMPGMVRLRLFRARRKLEKLTGWLKMERNKP